LRVKKIIKRVPQFDNRVFPTHVDADVANREGWWFKPEYIINDLNINSVITSPAHDETVSLLKRKPFLVEGYAYTGGGRKITRVEITVDDGKHWQLCNITRHEKPNRFGRYWCWIFWDITLDFVDIVGSKDIAVRAWDNSMNTQPQHLTW
jgi:nitrate reductase (NAD(P)H)